MKKYIHYYPYKKPLRHILSFKKKDTGFDQGIHNYLLHNKFFKKKETHKNDSSMICTTAYMKKFNFNKKQLINKSGKIYSIIHQYDRCYNKDGSLIFNFKKYMNKICVTYSHHKLGDLIWQLPYIKAISVYHGLPVDLIVREKTQAKIILRDTSHIKNIFIIILEKVYFIGLMYLIFIKYLLETNIRMFICWIKSISLQLQLNSLK